MDFPNALKMVFSGHRLARTAWSDPDRFIRQHEISVTSMDNGCERPINNVVDCGGPFGTTFYTAPPDDLVALDWELVR
jgi:hypothetical protein